MMGQGLEQLEDALCGFEGGTAGSGRRVDAVEGAGLYPVGRLAIESLIEVA